MASYTCIYTIIHNVYCNKVGPNLCFHKNCVNLHVPILIHIIYIIYIYVYVRTVMNVISLSYIYTQSHALMCSQYIHTKAFVHIFNTLHTCTYFDFDLYFEVVEWESNVGYGSWFTVYLSSCN